LNITKFKEIMHKLNNFGKENLIAEQKQQARTREIMPGGAI